MTSSSAGWKPSSTHSTRHRRSTGHPVPGQRAKKTALSATIRNRLKLRPATPNDLPLLRRWDEQPHVIASDPDDDWNWETELARSIDWREQLIAEIDGRPIGFIQIIDPAREETHYWSCTRPGRRAIDIWIGEASDLGRGYGTEMMKQAIERCFADPTVEAVLVDPLSGNTRACRFYERLGFEYVAEREFDGDRCAVYRLNRGT